MTTIDYMPDDVPKFWSRVDKNGPIPAHCPELGRCWVWTRAKAVSNGYGIFGPAFKRVYRAHRFAWVVTHGEITPGLYVLHACDNPPCVRPTHLSLGTQRDNMRDCANKGRVRIDGPKGATHHSAKLTEDQVRAIRARAAAGEMQRSLAREFSVTDTVVSAIVRRRTWKHLEEPQHQAGAQ
jgi:hypothetical protein